MLQFNQRRRLFLWINLLFCVLWRTGTAGPCFLASFTGSSLFDEHFDITRLSQSYDPGATVRVPCQRGYQSFFKLICTDNGWTHRGEKCKAIPCGHPGDVPFADFALVQGNDYVFGSQVQYTCYAGYQMTSFTSTRNCLQGGWDGHLPVCEPVSCPSLTVDGNKMRVTGDLEQAVAGSVVQFRCSSSDEELQGPAQIVCGDNGNWDNEPPICRAIICDIPPLNNFVVEGQKTEYRKNEVLRYRCNEKYKKVDGRPSVCEKVGQSGQWSPPPQCELRTCKVSARRVDGTTYSPQNKIIFTPDEIVTVTCRSTMWVKNKSNQTAELTCLGTGEWNFSPVCRLVTCDKFVENVNRWGSSTYRYSNIANIDESVWYRCSSGYEETSPTRTAKCTREGWEPDPLCKESRCVKPSFKNAEITNWFPKEIYDHNNRVDFKCTYDTSVTFYVDCYFGQWTPSNLPCREKPCTTRPNIENGVIHGDQKEEYEHDDTLMAKCKDETEFEVTCQSGEWNIPKLCQDMSCSKPNIKNGELIGAEMERFQHNHKAEVRCTTGSGGIFNITCQFGAWTPPPLCPEINTCGNPNIDNGFGVTYKNKLYYRCNEGYKLIIQGWWSVAPCVDGKWNTSDCIAKTDCGPLPHIPGMTGSARKSFRDGEKVNIVCKAGHNSVLEVLTCSEGRWNLENVERSQICIPIERTCRTPSAIENAIIMAPFKKEYSSNTTLTCKCQGQQEESTIQCNNGAWHPDPRNISCKETLNLQ